MAVFQTAQRQRRATQRLGGDEQPAFLAPRAQRQFHSSTSACSAPCGGTRAHRRARGASRAATQRPVPPNSVASTTAFICHMDVDPIPTICVLVRATASAKAATLNSCFNTTQFGTSHKTATHTIRAAAARAPVARLYRHHARRRPLPRFSDSEGRETAHRGDGRLPSQRGAVRPLLPAAAPRRRRGSAAPEGRSSRCAASLAWRSCATCSSASRGGTTASAAASCGSAATRRARRRARERQRRAAPRGRARRARVRLPRQHGAHVHRFRPRRDVLARREGARHGGAAQALEAVRSAASATRRSRRPTSRASSRSAT